MKLPSPDLRLFDVPPEALSRASSGLPSHLEQRRVYYDWIARMAEAEMAKPAIDRKPVTLALVCGDVTLERITFDPSIGFILEVPS